MTNLEMATNCVNYINRFEANKGDWSQIYKIDRIHTEEVKKLSTKKEKEEHKNFWKRFWRF